MKYTVYLQSAAEIRVDVEAETAEDAVDMSYEHAHAQLCHQCARDVDLAGEWEPVVAFEEGSGTEVWSAKP